MAGAGRIMKTADGYIIKTSDNYPTIGKDPADYNYPLYSQCSAQKIYSTEIDRITYTAVVDQ